MNFRYPPDAIVHRDHHHVDDDGYDGSIPHRGTLRISPCRFFGDDGAGAHSWLWVVAQEAHSPTGILSRHMPRLPRPIASITLLHRSEFDPGRGEFIAERGQYGRSWLRWPFLWKHHSSTSASQSMLPSISPSPARTRRRWRIRPTTCRSTGGRSRSLERAAMAAMAISRWADLATHLLPDLHLMT